ncbi:MAG: aldo/keto reductase [Gammaproteobacteria bacterium]|nr:aldo/keto reductase [Gammaproteobacteria bacterium]NIR84986.1 aldo/keto reductase [Gammaproteobacteria bacterium]NIR88253.1 aldo/keto reductase [Gammaproteobacteria bacterium]NIU06033.1 aldo/keto reductase [Gammaproteobacteria bacterium]NIV73452.1 aldo/keto reductase [Gammaproteobacteria bacterium]
MRRTIDRTNLEVFAIGLGAMSLSISDRPDDARAREVLAAALDVGVNFIDTADCYCIDDDHFGHNERLIASVLREWYRTDDVVVATKGGVTRPRGNWVTNGRPEHLRAACEASLQRLGLEGIRLYQLHAPDPDVPFEDSVGELARLKDEGKIKHVGLSNVSEEHVRRAQDIVPIASVQNRCNVLEKRDVTNGFVEFCAAQGLTYIPYSPVGGHNGHVRLAKVDVLNEIADRHETTGYCVALAWLLAQGEHVIPIPGASRPESIRASANTLFVELDGDDLERLNAIPDWT